jgi:para-aminobenzoate synthetase component 1
VRAGAKTSAFCVRALPGATGILGAFEALRASRAAGGHAWLLDSALGDSRLGRFSFAGIDPYAVLRAWGSRIELDVRRAARGDLPPGRTRRAGDPLAVARDLLPSLPADAAPGLPFVGGAIGWLGYELAERLEPLHLRGREPGELPDLMLLFVDRVLALDLASGEVFACGLGFGADAEREAERRAGELGAALAASASRAPAATVARPAASGRRDPDPAAFAKAVDAILEEIAAGNVYQACLTTGFERALGGDPWALYRRLRRRSPAPFASFLELPEVCVVSSSPERFLRLGSDRRVESRPIKGTRPRGADPARDAALRRALLGSAKDRAENLMIVDLVRNDLGRVCEPGSIAVPELMAIEAYAAVFQMVSTVTGVLRADRDAFDLVRAAFPPGSMTGAPKLAAMRLLERLEPARRGIYSGAIGYFDARGGVDLSVAIRLAVVRRGCARVQSGGGIVADSDPGAEWREALDKVAPLLAAIGEDGA